MLEVINVTKYFGALAALKNVSLVVKEKEIVGLIGPNGAGKTTLFNVVCGVYRPNSGRIRFMGRDITGLPPYKICKLGLARSHQIPRPFSNMKVLENIIVAMIYGGGESLSNARSKALECLKIVGLEKKKDAPAGSLNLLERKLLEVARALALKPRILLLDEPFSGLNPTEIEQAKATIKNLRDELGIGIFWIEHVMRALKGVVDRVIVLCYGEKIAEGTFEEVMCNEKVIDAYLGEKCVLE